MLEHEREGERAMTSRTQKSSPMKSHTQNSRRSAMDQLNELASKLTQAKAGYRQTVRETVCDPCFVVIQGRAMRAVPAA